MTKLEINGARLLSRINELGRIGILPDGSRTRLAGSDEDIEHRILGFHLD